MHARDDARSHRINQAGTDTTRESPNATALAAAVIMKQNDIAVIMKRARETAAAQRNNGLLRAHFGAGR